MTTSNELRSRNNNLNGTGSSNNTNSEEFNKKTEEQPNKLIKNSLIKLKSYLIALRVWSLSASIIPTILGKSAKLFSFFAHLISQGKIRNLNIWTVCLHTHTGLSENLIFSHVTEITHFLISKMETSFPFIFLCFFFFSVSISYSYTYLCCLFLTLCAFTHNMLIFTKSTLLLLLLFRCCCCCSTEKKLVLLFISSLNSSSYF